MSIFDNLLGAFFISFGGLWHRADIGHVGIQRMVLRKLTSHPMSYYANPTKETKLFLITHAYANCFLTSNKTYHTHRHKNACKWTTVIFPNSNKRLPRFAS